jgi:threonine aldolase
MNLNFASDNTGPVASAVMQAMAAANTGAAMPYGNDNSMTDLTQRMRTLFDMPQAEVLLVTTGSAANALSLATLCQPFQTVFCHTRAHIEEDECGAPEFYSGGAKLTLVGGPHAKMTPDALRAAMAALGPSVHNVQHGALSLTNVTELGSTYTLDEMATLTGIARQAGIPTHLDGARFANACAALGCSAADLAAGFDMISFGGTKNGCMGVEAIVIRNPAHAWETALRRKRGGHLWSKNRFLAAQMRAYLEGDLWLDLATRANRAGQRLAAGLRAMGAEFDTPPAANLMFVRLPRAAHARAMAAGAQYYLLDGGLEGAPETPLSCRLVCDWSKTDAEVDALLALFQSGSAA